MRYRLFPGLSIIALAGLVVGSYGMFDRLVNGLNPVAFGSYVPWGIWVAFYLFFLGLSAGAFLVTILTYLPRDQTLQGDRPAVGFHGAGVPALRDVFHPTTTWAVSTGRFTSFSLRLASARS